VVRGQRDAVQEEVNRYPARRPALNDREDDAAERKRNHDPVDRLEQHERDAVRLVPVVVSAPEEVVAVGVLPDDLQRVVR
jgi:hypothetical protein